MSTVSRVTMIVKNPFNSPVTCMSIPCATFNPPQDGDQSGAVMLQVGTVIPANGTGIFVSQSNNRLFCLWTNSYGGYWQMAMTCPKSSPNSACGLTPTAGLQGYSGSGTPTSFTFILGNANLADWGDPAVNKGDVIPWAEC